MKTKLIKPFAYSVMSVMALGILTGCGEKKFTVNGIIEGANNELVLLQKPDFHGSWITIDSIRTSEKGKFSLSQTAPGAPEIFRISMGDGFIYFPIDSLETIKITANYPNFGSQFTLAGSNHAELLSQFENDFRNLPANCSPDSIYAFKKEVFTKYMNSEQGSIVAYYILTKTQGNKFLFDPYNHDDAKYFAAVATGFKSVRPNDPHTLLLEKTSVDAMRRKNAARGSHREIEATEITVVDIELPDEKGNIKKLSDIVGQGKPTVVIFSPLTLPESPLINAELSKIYSDGKVNFYHVAIDPDQYAWREVAINLPWITVFDPEGEYSRTARAYNVTQMPLFFIYDVKGDLVNRAMDTEELKKLL